jgi:hypothetical protein
MLGAPESNLHQLLHKQFAAVDRRLTNLWQKLAEAAAPDRQSRPVL